MTQEDRTTQRYYKAADQLANARDDLAARDALLKQMAEALKESTEYVTATHASLAGAVGHNNVVLPVLERCRAALDAYDRMAGNTTNQKEPQ